MSVPLTWARRLATSPFAAAALVVAATLACLCVVDSMASSYDRFEVAKRLIKSLDGSEHRVSLDVRSARLDEVVDQLSKQSGVAFEVDWKELRERDCDPAAPVTAQFRDARLTSALQVVFDSASADPVVGWTASSSGKRLRLIDRRDTRFHIERVYPMHELLRFSTDASDFASGQEQVIEAIVKLVDSKGWMRLGEADGSIYFDGPFLIVRATPMTHMEVASLRAGLFERRGLYFDSWLSPALRTGGFYPSSR